MSRMDKLDELTEALKNAARQTCDASNKLCLSIGKSNGKLKRALKKNNGTKRVEIPISVVRLH